MPHLFVREGGGGLVDTPLDGDRVELRAPLGAAAPATSRSGNEPCATIRRSARADAATWLLIADAASRVLVNGEALRTGIRVLDSRDEIRCPELGVVFFDDERVPAVQRFEGAAHEMPCVRCTCPIEAGTLGVRCPSCGRWYHQDGDMRCWTLASFCQLCGQATQMDTERWTPEEEG